MLDLEGVLGLISERHAFALAGIGAGVCVYLFMKFVRYHMNKRHEARLPPGPKPLPLIGNLLDLPKGPNWIHWAKHKDLYGPISSVSVFRSHIIIINDLDIAFDLLDKRSHIYSSRPVLTFGGVMCGWDRLPGLAQYGERYRAFRRNMHQFMGSKSALSRLHECIDEATRSFLLDMVDSPEEFASHIRTSAGALILKLAYGYTIRRDANDPLVDLAELAMNQFSDATRPGIWIVDFFPFLKNLPPWIPGFSFPRIAKDYKKGLTDLTDKPFAFTKARLLASEAIPSYVANVYDYTNDKGITVGKEEEELVKITAASMYSGGSDTTVSVLNNFYLSMMLYPDVQRKAQAEIDVVVGTDRLPSLADREHLPYICALLKEVLRWGVVVPMGFPHVTTEDDIYRGYFIPKGAPVLPNIWQFTRDPRNYHDPSAFKPERFLPSDSDATSVERDPSNLVFGFGRRICPGMALADCTLFLSIAMSVWAFDVSKPTHPTTGKPIEPVVQYTNGIISHPTKFNCKIVPRSEKQAALIKASEGIFINDTTDAELLSRLP